MIDPFADHGFDHGSVPAGAPDEGTAGNAADRLKGLEDDYNAMPLADRLCIEARVSGASYEDCAAMDRLSCLLVQCDDMGLARTALDEAIGLAERLGRTDELFDALCK
ncbi:hypothetical protein NF552_23155 (plasmid) [Roseomonas mucosa]|nr:hypothetical protein NF552_23155 [Roseomonas mucosa]